MKLKYTSSGQNHCIKSLKHPGLDSYLRSERPTPDSFFFQLLMPNGTLNLTLAVCTRETNEIGQLKEGSRFRCAVVSALGV